MNDNVFEWLNECFACIEILHHFLFDLFFSLLSFLLFCSKAFHVKCKIKHRLAGKNETRKFGIETCFFWLLIGSLSYNSVHEFLSFCVTFYSLSFST